jgi:hypothetical protein
VIAWLWDATDPGRPACGNSGSRRAARQAAVLALRSGQAGTVRVEAATGDLGGLALTDGYRRTGHGWTATPRPSGRIDWVPLRAERPAA